ncbi:MAG: hypothetical protein O2954_09670 [bacterium]|nr:hypothetical protein [bacterium]
MKKIILILIFSTMAAGCARNNEYRYFSGLQLLEASDTLIPKIQQRLRTSEFRTNYDKTLVDRIGSSFKNFKHIRAYQTVLEDALVYIMVKTDMETLPDGFRGELIRPVSKLILSGKSGDQLLNGLDHIVTIIQEKSGEELSKSLSEYDNLLKQ